MMVKDEEQNLERCLNSIQNMRNQIDSELIIVDTGSKDRTVEIAQRYTDKVYFHPWDNDFSGMRNITIGYAKGDWLFILDADEEVTNDQDILTIFHKANTLSQYNTLCMTVRSFLYKNNEHDFSDVNSVRFFRNDGEFHFESVVHNIPIYKGPIGSISGIIKHYGYINDDPILMEKKFDRTSKLLKDALEKEPENIYYIYQLSVSYGMHNEWEKSKEKALKGYNLLKKFELKEIDRCFYFYGQLLLIYKHFQEYLDVVKIAEEALLIRPDDVDTRLYLADAYICLDQRENAIKGYINYLDLVLKYERRELFLELDSKMDTLKFKSKIFNNLISLLYTDYRFKEVLKYYVKYIELCDLDKMSEKTLTVVVKSAITEKAYSYLLEIHQHENLRFRKTLEKVLESEITLLETKERNDIYDVFRKDKSDYGKLHYLRFILNSHSVDLESAKKWIFYLMESRDLNIADVFFKYCLLSGNTELFLDELCRKPKWMNLEAVNQLMNLVEEFREWAFNFIEGEVPDVLGQLILKSKIQRLFLLEHHYNNEVGQGMLLYKNYIGTRRVIVEKMYQNAFVLNEENWIGMESDEDRLCLYISEALKREPYEAVGYLKKAVSVAGDLLPYVHQVVFEKEAEMKMN